VLTVLFLPRGFAGFIMMHRVAWVQKRMQSLVMPYLLTGVPAMITAVSLVAIIEMLHHRGEEFHFLLVTLSSTSVFSWALVLAVAGASIYAVRLSLPRLHSAWEDANKLVDADEDNARP